MAATLREIKYRISEAVPGDSFTPSASLDLYSQTLYDHIYFHPTTQVYATYDETALKDDIELQLGRLKL